MRSVIHPFSPGGILFQAEHVGLIRLYIYQGGNQFGTRHVQVSRRHRAAPWSWEHHHSEQAHWVQFGWASPTKHRWWATSVTVQLNRLGTHGRSGRQVQP